MAIGGIAGNRAPMKAPANMGTLQSGRTTAKPTAAKPAAKPAAATTKKSSAPVKVTKPVNGDKSATPVRAKEDSAVSKKQTTNTVVSNKTTKPKTATAKTNTAKTTQKTDKTTVTVKSKQDGGKGTEKVFTKSDKTVTGGPKKAPADLTTGKTPAGNTSSNTSKKPSGAGTGGMSAGNAQTDQKPGNISPTVGTTKIETGITNIVQPLGAKQGKKMEELHTAEPGSESDKPESNKNAKVNKIGETNVMTDRGKTGGAGSRLSLDGGKGAKPVIAKPGMEAEKMPGSPNTGVSNNTNAGGSSKNTGTAPETYKNGLNPGAKSDNIIHKADPKDMEDVPPTPSNPNTVADILKDGTIPKGQYIKHGQNIRPVRGNTEEEIPVTDGGKKTIESPDPLSSCYSKQDYEYMQMAIEENKKILGKLNEWYQEDPKRTHMILGIAGWIPWLGAAADLVDAALYNNEGKDAEAKMALVATLFDVGVLDDLLREVKALCSVDDSAGLLKAAGKGLSEYGDEALETGVKAAGEVAEEAAEELAEETTEKLAESAGKTLDNVVIESGTASSKGGLNSINKIDDLLVDPSKLAGVSGDELYEYLIKNGYDVKPLSKGSYKGIPFEEGGGFKVNWGGDRILQYHPADASHHGGAYFKIFSGETGTIRIDLDGNIIE